MGKKLVIVWDTERENDAWLEGIRTKFVTPGDFLDKDMIVNAYCPSEGGPYIDPKLVHNITQLREQKQLSVIILPGDGRGKELAAGLAFQLRMPCMSDVYDIREGADTVAFKKSLYNGHVTGAYSVQIPCVITVNPPLAHRELMFVCGNAFNDHEKVLRLRRLAEKAGADMGASRPCVTSGIMPQETLTGISGQSVAPKLCVVFGASGAQAFMTGIEKSGRIVAVNKDERAMIFGQCDLGLCCDCFALLECVEAVMDCEKV